MGKDKQFKIYCAGPLFNDKEREEMLEIATVLEENGFNVFLPHRDGFEFSNIFKGLKSIGSSREEANALVNKLILSLDVYE